MGRFSPLRLVPARPIGYLVAMISPDNLKLYPHPGNPLPRNARVHAVTTSDGKTIRAMTAGPANPKGTVVVMNGRAEFLERYFETARDLIARGYSVVTFDWRGQGGSERLHQDPTRGHGGNFAGFDDDLESVMQQVAENHCVRPFYALAHSTGAHVVLRNLRQTPCWFEKAVLTSPLLGFNYGAWPPVIAHAIARIAVATGFGAARLPGYRHGPMQRAGFKNNPLTSDAKRWDRDITTLEIHPELGVGGPTFGWFKGAVASLNELQAWKRKALIGCPVLIVASGQEWVVKATSARDFAARIPGISYMQIKGAKHEIMMEQDQYRDQFWSAFDSFL